VNEPLTTARFSALYGHWYPHRRDDRLFVRALVNQLRGVVLAMRAVRSINVDARLVQTEDVGTSDGTAGLRPQVEHERERRWLTWDLLAGLVDARHPLYAFLRGFGVAEHELAFFTEQACPADVLGVNYYVTSDRWLDERLELYPAWSHGGNGEVAYADVEAVRAHEWWCAGHEAHLLAAWKRYRRPVAITEVHLGCTREEQMRWFVEAWDAALRARGQGVDVRAVTAWALLGSYDWDSLVTSDAGHYEPGVFDIRAPAPRATALAGVARDVAAGRSPNHPVLRGQGWWRRPTRLLYDADARTRSAATIDGAPILVVGKRGTLGRAFQRICRQRGLRVHMVGRPEMDASDPSGVDALLRNVDPWAVVNAAGYVRVDEAETDRLRCWSDNVTAPVTLAAACRRRRLPMVTFSSALVFDGTERRPYTETDVPAPVNIYGAAKAEAERRVLALLSEALVVRTSAFFGPWDNANFAAATIRALSNDVPMRAADDCIVSPTYVPDLVHAVLDLLIDGERGVWHLANDGAVTWHQFGLMLARRASLHEELMEPCGCREIWRAARPTYSALGSIRGRLLSTLDAAVSAYVTDLSAHGSNETAPYDHGTGLTPTHGSRILDAWRG